MADHVTKVGPAPVVVAVATCARGVLLGRRHDARPLWTFIAGEIEAGETPVDAAIREVREETGLAVRAVEHDLCSRAHPATGRTMIYLVCEPVGERTDVRVGDPEELAEVRWVPLAEALELLGDGVYEPVRRHLVRVLRPGNEHGD